jgi:hypothetical protein
MTEKANKTSKNPNTEIFKEETFTLSCACCNGPIKLKKILIVYFGTLIQLCGEPCGVRDYLETQ